MGLKAAVLAQEPFLTKGRVTVKLFLFLFKTLPDFSKSSYVLFIG